MASLVSCAARVRWHDLTEYFRFEITRVILRAASKVVGQAIPHASPDRFMTSPVVKPVREVEWTPENLTLDIWAPAGKIALDFIDGRLDHFQTHRGDGSTRSDANLGHRVSRKRGQSTISVSHLHHEWLRLHIENPASADSSAIRRLLRPHIARSSASWQERSTTYFGQIFAVIREQNRTMTTVQRNLCDRRELGSRLQRGALVRGLALSGDRSQISVLRKRYRSLCREFALPAP